MRLDFGKPGVASALGQFKGPENPGWVITLRTLSSWFESDRWKASKPVVHFPRVCFLLLSYNILIEKLNFPSKRLLAAAIYTKVHIYDIAGNSSTPVCFSLLVCSETNLQPL